MQGQILDYSVQNNSGIITTQEGRRYQFEGSEWKDASVPSRGMEVDFDVDDNNHAIGVYKALRSSSTVKLGSSGSKEKSRVVAGLLAFFLGFCGAHKFYLGFTLPGLIYLMCSWIFMMLAGVTHEDIFLIPTLIIYMFSSIDAVIYFTRTDEDFQRIYVEDKKQWF